MCSPACHAKQMPEQGSGSPASPPPQQPPKGPQIVPVQPRTTTRSKQGSAVVGPGNISIGHAVTATSANAVDDQVILALRDALARLRERLVAIEAPTADQQDALGAVDLLQAELDESRDPGPQALRRLRLQVRGLIGMLAPRSETIAEVAALAEIVSHL